MTTEPSSIKNARIVLTNIIEQVPPHDSSLAKALTAFVTNLTGIKQFDPTLLEANSGSPLITIMVNGVTDNTTTQAALTNLAYDMAQYAQLKGSFTIKLQAIGVTCFGDTVVCTYCNGGVSFKFNAGQNVITGEMTDRAKQRLSARTKSREATDFPTLGAGVESWTPVYILNSGDASSKSSVSVDDLL